MKKKFFVLKKESDAGPAKLQYYGSEKKWRAGGEPKRSIVLKSCFNISRKLHTKHKFVIALYTEDDCFSMVMENEEEFEEWLMIMLQLQRNGIETDEDGKLKPMYEHVWQVIVDDKDLEFSQDINGPHRLGLTSKSLSLVKMNSSSEKFDALEFPLMSIRRCGHSGKHFFIELGRSAVTGAGGMWMETEATIVAQNMHETILSAMKSSRNKEELCPHNRPRSASTSENTKPITTRRPVGVVMPQSLSLVNSALSNSRERCDSMPTRPRTITEDIPDSAFSPHSSIAVSTGSLYQREMARPHTVYAWPSMNSPSLSSLNFSPGSLSTSVCSTGSNTSFEDVESYQQLFHLSRYSHTLSADATFSSEKPIKEVPDEYLIMSPDGNMNSSIDNQNIISQGTDYLKMDPWEAHIGAAAAVEHKGHSNSLHNPKDYMDMRSPPSSNPGSYIPMSVIGSLNVDASLAKKSSNISLDESPLPEKVLGKGGYVAMAPGGVSDDIPIPMQDGYLDMTPLSGSLPKEVETAHNLNFFDFNGSNSTLQDFGATHDKLSDSTEFKLDKVPSLVKQTDEDSQDFIKPVRAYSIGSRSQICESRTRAYSVGSEASKPRFKVSSKAHLGDSKDFDHSAKSSSAPVLQDSFSTTKKSSPVPVTDYGNDLMEIDYSKLPDEKQCANQENLDQASKRSVSKTRHRTSSRTSSNSTALVCLNELTEKIGNQTKDETNDDYIKIRSNIFNTIQKLEGNTSISKTKNLTEEAKNTSSSNTDYFDMDCSIHDEGIHLIKEEPTSDLFQIEGNYGADKKYKFNESQTNDVFLDGSENFGFANVFVRDSRVSPVMEQNTNFSCFLQNDQGGKSLYFPCDPLCIEARNSVPPKIYPNCPNQMSEQKSIDSYCSTGGNIIAKENTYLTSAKCSIIVSDDKSEYNATKGLGQVYLPNKEENKQNSNPANCLKPVIDSMHGDYINLDLNIPCHLSPKIKPVLPVRNVQIKTQLESSNLLVTRPVEPDYVNIKLGKPYTPLPNPALVSSTYPTTVTDSTKINNRLPSSTSPIPSDAEVNSQIPYASQCINLSPSSPLNKNSILMSRPAFFPQTLPAFRKQMSAPAAPSSLQPEPISPGRKSSCPVTGSISMVRTPVALPANTSKFINLPPLSGISSYLKASTSRSPDHSSVSSVSSVSDEISSNHSSPKTFSNASGNVDRRSLAEMQYENVNIQPSSSASSSRPSSVSSEKELNYASLDLAPTASEEAPRSPRTVKLSHQQQVDDGEPLMYSEIDFTKSEGLRHTTGTLREGRL